MQDSGEIEQVHVRRGGGGLLSDGRSLDSIKREGVTQEEVLPASFRLNKKEAWLWRLRPTKLPKGSRKVVEPEASAQAAEQSDGAADALRLEQDART